MKYVIGKSALGLALLLSAGLLRAEGETTPAATADALDARGIGCPNSGTWTHKLSADSQELRFEMEEMGVEMNSWTAPATSRHQCLMQIRVRAPSGWQYSVRGIRYSGWWRLDRHVQATLQTKALFQGQTKAETFSIVKMGPVHENYKLSTTSDPATRVWSDCDTSKPLLLYFQTHLMNKSPSTHPSAFGHIERDSLEMGLLFFAELEWRRCTIEPAR